MSELEEMIHEHMVAAYARAEEEWLNTLLYGSGTGDPKGILSTAPAPRPSRPITLADVDHLHDLFKDGAP